MHDNQQQWAKREPAVPAAVLAAARGRRRRGCLRVAPHELHCHRRRVPVRRARETYPAPSQGRRHRQRRRQARGLRRRLRAAHQRSCARALPGRRRRLATGPCGRHRAVLPDVQDTDEDVRRPRVQMGWNHGSMGQRVAELHRRLHRVRHVAQQPGRPALQTRPRRLGRGDRRPHAYYWPHFTHIPAPSDKDVMMFTMSKPSGHAGSRFGWALIRDEKVAKRAYEYVQNSIMGASRDTQLRMLGIVKVMLANLHSKEDIFAVGHDVMRTRWRRLNAVVSRSRRISLQKIAPEYCTYFKRVREPSPAYAWVKCEREEDEDCHGALLKAKIITRTGVGNEASSRYTRISLLKSDDDFEVLMERVTDLVNAEEYDTPGSSSM